MPDNQLQVSSEKQPDYTTEGIAWFCMPESAPVAYQLAGYAYFALF